jgi:hypothetical protein
MTWSRSTFFALGLLIGSLLMTGCDPVRSTVQPVHLRVVDLASERPVPGTDVMLRDDYVIDEPMPMDWKMTPEEYKAYQHQEWDGRPWFRGIVEESGRVRIDVTHTAIDHTWGNKPSASRDVITGKPYAIKVKRDGAPEEELKLVMKPGETVKGKSFVVVVGDIGSPEYVPTR